MRKPIIIFFVVLLGFLSFIIFRKQIESWPIFGGTGVYLVARYDKTGEQPAGGNSQYFIVTISSNTEIGDSVLTFVEDVWAIVPNPKVSERYSDYSLYIDKGRTATRLLLGKVKKVLLNGTEIPFKQSYPF